MPEEDLRRIVAETDYEGRDLHLRQPAHGHGAGRRGQAVRAPRAGCWWAPTRRAGTGVAPAGILREICFLASLGGIAPEHAVAMATGNTGRAHGLDLGAIAEGRPADLVIMDRITGSVSRDALDSFAKGDLPGISV